MGLAIELRVMNLNQYLAWLDPCSASQSADERWEIVYNSVVECRQMGH